MDNEREMKFREIMNEVLPENDTYILSKELAQIGFFTAPASTKYHGAYPGGLFDHSLAVTLNLVKLTKRLGLSWERMCSPYIVGMLHDLCKCDCYIQNEDGTFSFNKNLPLIGHGDKSVIIAQKFFDLTEEEILCIRWHMGAYDDKEVWGNLGAAIEQYPNVLYTHTADMIASRIEGT